MRRAAPLANWELLSIVKRLLCSMLPQGILLSTSKECLYVRNSEANEEWQSISNHGAVCVDTELFSHRPRSPPRRTVWSTQAFALPDWTLREQVVLDFPSDPGCRINCHRFSGCPQVENEAPELRRLPASIESWFRSR